MIEVKELIDTTNKEVFIDRNYLRKRAIYSFNIDAVDAVKKHKTDSPIANEVYSMLNGATGIASHLDIITWEEKKSFFDALLHCMFDCPMLTAPQLNMDGSVTIKLIEELFEE